MARCFTRSRQHGSVQLTTGYPRLPRCCTDMRLLMLGVLALPESVHLPLY